MLFIRHLCKIAKFSLSILLLQCLITTTVLAQNLSFPGGILDFEISKTSNQLPIVKYGTKDALVLDQENSWRVLVGIDLNTVPGDYLVYIDTQFEPINDYQHNFSVNQKDYPMLPSTESPLRSAYKKFDLVPKNLSELKFSNTQQPDFPFSVPALGKWSTDFGIRYESNNTEGVKTKNFVSLTTTELLSIASPQHGIISKIELNDNNIASVTIDHGRGLYSIITGLSDLSVKLGEGIPHNSVIGKIPRNENTFSPNTIYWQCILNGVFINPHNLTTL